MAANDDNDGAGVALGANANDEVQKMGKQETGKRR